MEKVEVNKLECCYPTLFKIMWLATVVWMIVGLANYFGHWLLPDKLDSIGLSILFLFGATLVFCFKNGFQNLLSNRGQLIYDTVTKKAVSYVFILSFVILLIISMWEICGTADRFSDSYVNGGILSIPLEMVFTIVGDVIKAGLISFGFVVLFWYIRTCFVLFSGRIRRLGIEIALALLLMAYLSKYMSDSLWVDALVLCLASSFLYDIWRLADFQGFEFQKDWIREIIEEE